jgi:hypothetical protein
VDLGLFHPGDNFSVEAWFKQDATAAATYNAIVARWDGSYELDLNPTDTPNLVVRNTGNGFGIVAGLAPVSRGQWHHLVGIFSNGILSIYVDGVKGSESNIGGALQNAGPSPDRVMIGATREGVYNFKGNIDEVAMYDYPLSVTQVRAHLRAAQSAAGPALAIKQAVIVSWPSFPTGYVLQSAPTLNGEYKTVTNTPYADGNNLWLPFTFGPSQSFFKLVKP